MDGIKDLGSQEGTAPPKDPGNRLCSVGGETCGPQKKLWNGMCRSHRFYADPKSCIEEDCGVQPTPEMNKFVGGRCPKHYQQHRAALKRAAQGSCRVGTGCGPQNRLYEGLCRRHWMNLDRYGSYTAPVCVEPGCETGPDTDAGQFRSGRCNMHYLRHTRALQRAADLGERICPQCRQDMSAARRNSRHCSTRCTQAASTARNLEAIRMRSRLSQARRKAAKLNNPQSEPFTVDQALALIDSLGSRCTYCGSECDISDLHLDHVIPLGRGGPHALWNITVACSGCNISKKDRLLLLEWAPVLLGGKPRWDAAAPRGRKGNPWDPARWRDDDGPLPAIAALADEYPELQRVIRRTEDFLAAG